MEYTQRISSLSAIQFTVEKSDFKWFQRLTEIVLLNVDVDVDVDVVNFKFHKKFNTRKIMLENLDTERSYIGFIFPVFLSFTLYYST